MSSQEDSGFAQAAGSALLTEARQLHRAGRTNEALDLLDRVLGDGEKSSSQDAAVVSDALLLKAYYLREAGALEESITAVDALLDRCREEPAAVVRDRVADAHLLKGLDLLGIQATRAAVTEFDVLAKQVGDPTTDRQRTALARGLVLRGAALRELGQVSDAIEAWRQVVDRFEEHPPGGEPFVVAEAIRLRSEAQAGRGEIDEALSALDLLQTQHADAQSTDARAMLVEVCATRARLLAAYGRREREKPNLITLSRLVREEPDVFAIARMTDAICSAVVVMITGEHGEMVTELLNVMLAKLSASQEASVRAAWALVEVLMSISLVRRGEVQAAMRSYEALFDRVDALLPMWDELEHRAREARLPPMAITADLGRAATLQSMGRTREALRALDLVLDRYARSGQERRGGYRAGLRALGAQRRSKANLPSQVEPFIATTILARATLASHLSRPRRDVP